MPSSPSTHRRSPTCASQRATNALALYLAAHGLTTGLAADTADAENQEAVHLPGVVVNDEAATNELSGVKYTQPLLDTPQTIDVIPSEVYSSQGATTLSDVLKNTPGITFFAGEGGSANRTGGDAFYLRGFDTSNSIFVDGVRDEGAVVHDTFDIGQVEVFKGPSSENGRGGTAGYVNLETKLPTMDADQTVEITHGFSAAGSRDNDRVTIDLDAPVENSPVRGTAFRLNLVDQEGGLPGRKLAENNRWGLAPSLAMGLGTNTRVLLTYEHLHEHNLPDYGLPSTAVAGYAPPAASGATSLYTPGTDTSDYYGFANYDRELVNEDAFMARIEHDFGPSVKLQDQTNYEGNSRFVEATSPSGNSATPGYAALTHGIYATTNSILSHQTNLADVFSTGTLEHSVTAGLEMSREIADNPIWSAVAAGSANPNYLVSLSAPMNFPTSLFNYSPHTTGTATDTRIDTGSLYAFDTVELGPKWELNAGVRLERYNLSELSTTAAAPALPALAAQPATPTTPAIAAAAAVAAVAQSNVRLQSAHGDASWKVGLVYKPAPDSSVYASYATSVRPPGTSGATNTLSTTTTSADNPLLAPERAINYELGAKWNGFDQRLLTSIALFKSVNTDVPAADPTTGLVDQTSSQTVQGVELGASGKLTKAWLVYAGYAHMEPKISSEISTNAQGLTLPLLPRDSGNLWTTYAFHSGLTVGGGTQYMGSTERLQATQAPTSATFANGVPSYWVFNAMLSYSVTRHFTMRLNANNVADKDYVISLNNNGYRLNLGAPRNFQVTGTVSF